MDVGLRFAIREGGRTVGSGTVVTVLIIIKYKEKFRKVLQAGLNWELHFFFCIYLFCKLPSIN
jgi:hypothetical protein